MLLDPTSLSNICFRWRLQDVVSLEALPWTQGSSPCVHRHLWLQHSTSSFVLIIGAFRQTGLNTAPRLKTDRVSRVSSCAITALAASVREIPPCGVSESPMKISSRHLHAAHYLLLNAINPRSSRGPVVGATMHPCGIPCGVPANNA